MVGFYAPGIQFFGVRSPSKSKVFRFHETSLSFGEPASPRDGKLAGKYTLVYTTH